MRKPRRSAWGFAATLAAAAITAACGSQPAAGNGAAASPAAPGPPPVTSLSAARKVLTGYAAAVTRADRQRNTGQLAAAESGTSYQMDAEGYRWTQVTDPANHGYQALSTTGSTFDIPLRSAGPAWWVATAAWTQPGKPKAAPARTYLVFIKAGGSRWVQVLDPILDHAATAPAAATGKAGYAEVLSGAQAAGLAADPAALPALTASYLNAASIRQEPCPRPGACPQSHPAVKIKVPDTSQLGDMNDQAFWAKHFPAGSVVGDQHTAVPADPVYALAAAGGGALAFYDLHAVLTLAAPGGAPFQITIPSLYAPGQSHTKVTVAYVEQFAAYIPPAGHGLPEVVAANGGPTGRH